MPILILFFWIVVGLAAQVLVFNHLTLAGGIVLLYLYVAVKMPVEVYRPLQILTGFLIGLIIDVFCCTPGLHAFALTTTMALRLPILHLYVLSEDMKTGLPDADKLGWAAFLRFIVTVVLLHCVVLYVVEAFTLFDPLMLVVKIFMSSLLTLIFIIVLEIIFRRK